MSDFANLIIRIATLGANEAAAGVNKAKDAASDAERQSLSLKRATDSLSSAYSDLRKSAVAYGSYRIVKEIAQTGLEFDRMKRSLYAATGTMEGVTTEMQFLRDETDRIGISLLSTGKMYAQLTAASKGTTISQEEVREIFTSVAEASVVLGLSADDTKGAFRALVQVMSKGKVQAEELRGQLGERFPGAFQAAARAMGLTVAQLSKMLEDGNVVSDEFLPKFAREIRKTYQDAVPEAMDSAQAAFARFSNALAEAENEVAEGGLLDALATLATWSANMSSKGIDLLKSESEWFAALTLGQISFFDWLTSSQEETIAKLKELKYEMSGFGQYVRLPAPKNPYATDSVDKASVETDAERRERERKEKKAKKEYEDLVDSLRSQRDQIEYDYEERLRVLNAHETKGTEVYEKYYSRIKEIRDQDLADYVESSTSELSSLIDSLMSEEEAIQASYERRKKIIEDSNLSDSEKSNLIVKVTADRDSSLEDLKERNNQEFETIRLGLLNEEEEILASFNRRREIILANTEATEIEKQDLIKRLEDEFASNVMGEWGTANTYEDELAEIEDFYARRKALILENVLLTEEERTDLEAQLASERNERINTLEMERLQVITASGQQAFDALADMAKEYAGEQSGLYKTMFAASKAFAIADAIVKIQQGIAAAASEPWPLNLAAMASTAAATASIVSTISSTNYSGEYDTGGTIPAGSVGLVGEVGPELVQGPANVTSRRDTAALLEKASQPSPPPVNNIRIVNAFDSSVVGDYIGSDAGEKAILNVVRRNASTIRQLSQ